MLDRRIEIGRRIVALDPDNADAYQHISSSLVKRADWEEGHAGDGVPLVAGGHRRPRQGHRPRSHVAHPPRPGHELRAARQDDGAPRRGSSSRPGERPRSSTSGPRICPRYQEYNLTLLYLAEAAGTSTTGRTPAPLIERASRPAEGQRPSIRRSP